VKKNILIILSLFLFSIQCLAKELDDKDRSVFFFQPEFLVGKTLPAHSNFPETRLQTVFALSFGKYMYNPEKSWAVYYNYPAVGITFSKASLGNDGTLGNAYTLMPFISFNTSKKLRHSFHIKLGLGASYFTHHFDKYENPDNKAIGSTFTWTFQAALHFNLIASKHFLLNIGGGFIHHSNGHTQLPNLGLNSLLASISAVVFLSPLDDYHFKKYEKPRIKKSKQFFIELRNGIGIHELGDTDTPLARVKKSVFSASFGGGIIFKQMVKIKAGFTYRFYSHYYNFILENEPENYVDYPVLNSSNLFIYGGFEFLIGHFSIDAELGLNIFKPFYKEHSSRFENDGKFSYTLKRVFATRLGLRFYAISTAKNPPNNVFIGAHINANMGQADFSEVSVGFVHVFNNSRSPNRSATH